MIDLHMHSIFSDGTHTPEELIELAVDAGLSAAALTDHDTVRGVSRFLKAARQNGLFAFSGVEVSTSFAPGELHMLGYGLDHRDSVLATQLDWIRRARQSRNEEVLHKLHKLGMPLRWSEIEACAGGDVIGRPHFAQAMVHRGYVRNTKEAFRRYLTRGAPAYAKRRTLTPADAIEVIGGAGGLAIMAHPFTVDLNRSELRDLLRDLADAGLAGVEVYYPQHTPDQMRAYLAICSELDLIPTGGTDFHGGRTPDLKLGRGFGALKIPDEVHTRLQDRLAAVA